MIVRYRCRGGSPGNLIGVHIMSETKKVLKVKPPVTEAEKAARVAIKTSKFIEVAEKRAAKAIQAVKLIGNLTSANYVYTVEQGEKIVGAIQAELDALWDGFKTKKVKEKVVFKL